MTPSVRDILRGCATVLATPPSADAGPEYAASRFGLVTMLLSVVSQDVERGAAAAMAENADMRAVFADTAPAYDTAMGGRLAVAAAEYDGNLALPALDAVNARLRRLLIELHERIEDAGDAANDRAIIALYGRMAAGRRLVLGG